MVTGCTNTATTMMSCAPSLVEQERRFLEILQRVQRFDIDDTGALLLGGSLLSEVDQMAKRLAGSNGR